MRKANKYYKILDRNGLIINEERREMRTTAVHLRTSSTSVIPVSTPRAPSTIVPVPIIISIPFPIALSIPSLSRCRPSPLIPPRASTSSFSIPMLVLPLRVSHVKHHPVLISSPVTIFVRSAISSRCFEVFLPCESPSSPSSPIETRAHLDVVRPVCV